MAESGDPKKHSDEEHSQSESSRSDQKEKFRTRSRKLRSKSGKQSNGSRKLRSEKSSGMLRSEEKETEVEPEKTPAKTLRVWSQDDVIVILKGMLEYSADPVADWDAFFHFINKKLHVDVTRRQLQDKVRRLKERYNINKKKENKGRGLILPNPHEELAYQLSKSIWGKNAVQNSRPPSKRKGTERSFPVSKRAKPVEDMVLSSFENTKGVDEWNKLKMEEVKIYIRHLEIKAQQTKLVIGCLKSP